MKRNAIDSVYKKLKETLNIITGDSYVNPGLPCSTVFFVFPLFHIVSRFDFSRYIVFIMYLDTIYI